MVALTILTDYEIYILLSLIFASVVKTWIQMYGFVTYV
jgi:hypothetical protein